MFEYNETDMMMDALCIVMDEHGIRCEDGHWMTEDELLALPAEEMVIMFNLCYGKN